MVPTIVKIHVCDNCLNGVAGEYAEACAVCAAKRNPNEPLEIITKAIDEPISKYSKQYLKMKKVEDLLGVEGVKNLIENRQKLEKMVYSNRKVFINPKPSCCGKNDDPRKSNGWKPRKRGENGE